MGKRLWANGGEWHLTFVSYKIHIGQWRFGPTTRGRIMPKRARKYEDSLVESLKDPKEAAAYLNVHLQDKGDDADELFLMALRDVAKAFRMTEIADRAGLGRESLYKALSAEGNPKLTTLRAPLDAMGLKLTVEAAETRKAS